MKALAFQAGNMDEYNGTIWRNAPHYDMGEGWVFEGKRIMEFGVIGCDSIKTSLKERLERHHSVDSALLNRIATYEVTESNWAALIAVEGLDGIFYLRRMPGMVSSLIYYPLPNQRAIVVTHRSTNPKFYEKDKVKNVYHAIDRYRISRR